MKMKLQEQIQECKAQALAISNFAQSELTQLASDLIDMLPVQVYSDSEAQEQLES